MVIWKTIDTLKDEEAAQWQALTSEVLGHPVHAQRRLGFCRARSALRECLLQVGERPDIRDLILKEHCQLARYPQYSFSLSHTSRLGAAALVNRMDHRSVGIDLEGQDRKVSASVIERIRHPLDLDLLPIQSWCLKEASFKAIMNTGNFPTPVEFSAIQLSPDRWNFANLAGDWQLIETDGHFLAIATLKN